MCFYNTTVGILVPASARVGTANSFRICEHLHFFVVENPSTANSKQLLSTSVTRSSVKKSAQLCPNIAQNGALLNKKNFRPKKFMAKVAKS
jgi:hypothetical protein